jgi:hypothetical protein
MMMQIAFDDIKEVIRNEKRKKKHPYFVRPFNCPVTVHPGGFG